MSAFVVEDAFSMLDNIKKFSNYIMLMSFGRVFYTYERSDKYVQCRGMNI